MGQSEDRSLEAQIADCCREMYWATEPEVAMKSWARLRLLKAARDALAAEQFRHEALVPAADASTFGASAPGTPAPGASASGAAAPG